MHKVRLVEFKIADFQKEEIEAELESLLNEGYQIVAQHESEGYLNMTLVRNGFYSEEEEDTPPNVPAAAPKFKIVNGAVERVSTPSGPVLH